MFTEHFKRLSLVWAQPSTTSSGLTEGVRDTVGDGGDCPPLGFASAHPQHRVMHFRNMPWPRAHQRLAWMMLPFGEAPIFGCRCRLVRAMAAQSIRRRAAHGLQKLERPKH